MNPINDRIFGALEFKGSWVRDEQIHIFGAKTPVRLRVEGNDEDESIWEEQRLSYIKFRSDEERFLETAIEALFKYYCDIHPLLRAHLGSSSAELAPVLVRPSELAKLVKFTTLVFPIVTNENVITFGIMGSCTWDPEHGIAIKFTNDEVEIGGQDILT